MAEPAPALEVRLDYEGIGVSRVLATAGSQVDAEQTTSLARQLRADWLVLDGYHFDAAYQRAIVEMGLGLLVVDDYGHASHYYADLVLNQNIHASEALYNRREPYTDLLLGTSYVLLRREFGAWRGWQREIAGIGRRVLVSLGGADPDNVTCQAIAALEGVDVQDLEAVVLVGASNPHSEELRHAVRQSRLSFCLKRNVSNMPELMAWADVVVSAGGSTCWELAFMGVPGLLLITAENQRAAVQRLSEEQVFLCMEGTVPLDIRGLALAVTELTRSRVSRQLMSQRGQQLVDGLGVMRVANSIGQSVARSTE
jgi:UDP-2,4-diacetamido-2,4,6-trideoxy-beta-L-altropyranose hydrolase